MGQWIWAMSGFRLSSIHRRMTLIAALALAPSIIFAVALSVSVITVKRAYRDLEQQGVIVTRQGKGSTVAPDSDVGARLVEQDLRRALDQVIELGKLLGYTPKELASKLLDEADKADKADKAREEL